MSTTWARMPSTRSCDVEARRRHPELLVQDLLEAAELRVRAAATATSPSDAIGDLREDLLGGGRRPRRSPTAAQAFDDLLDGVGGVGRVDPVALRRAGPTPAPARRYAASASSTDAGRECCDEVGERRRTGRSGRRSRARWRRPPSSAPWSARGGCRARRVRARAGRCRRRRGRSRCRPRASRSSSAR